MRTKLIILLLFPLLVFGQTNNSIKGYWRLDGNSNDVSGNTHTGTDANITYSLMNGKFNQGAGFNGTSSKITTATNIGISGDATFTIAFWMQFSDITTHYYYVLSWGGTSTTSLNSINVVIGSAVYADIAIGFEDNGSARVGTSSACVSNNIWYWVVFTKTPGSPKTTTTIYLNGVSQPILSSSTTSTPSITDSPVRLGVDVATSGTVYMKGHLDEVIIDNTSWSQAKVSWMYNQYLGIVYVPNFLKPLYFLYLILEDFF